MISFEHRRMIFDNKQQITTKKQIMELLINLGIISAVFLSGVRITQENQRAVIYRLGRYYSVKGPGIYWLFPFIEKQKQVDIRTKTIELREQTLLTKDNVNIKVKAILWYKITEPKDAITKITDYNMAVYQYSRTSIRNIMSLYMLDEIIKNKAHINERLRLSIQTAANPWGIQIELLEIKELEIPLEFQKELASEAKTLKEDIEKRLKKETELKPNKTNQILNELDRPSSEGKHKRTTLTSDHWY